jgi:phosphoribosylformylglycinamidine synthase
LADVQAVLDHWELPHAVVGSITEDGLVRILFDGQAVVNVPVTLFTDHCPVYTLAPVEDPAAAVARRRPAKAAPPWDGAAALLALLAHPNVGSKLPVWRRYDHMVGTNTIAGPGGDAAVLRLKGTPSALVLSLDGNGRLCFLDPYIGGASAVLEAARNVACCGARPLCATDGLNFGNPEKPGVAFQLTEAVRGMGDACRALGIPVVSGNVSLYNESQNGAIYPTPIVGVAGLLGDASRACGVAFRGVGSAIYLAGAPQASLAGSLYQQVRDRGLSGSPLALDFDLEARLLTFLQQAVEGGLLQSAHDCSDGGLAVALAESAIAGSIGARIEYRPELAGDGDSTVFGEGQSRVLISVTEDNCGQLERLAHECDVPLTRLGTVGGAVIEWTERFAVPLDTAREAWEHALDVLG